MRIVRISRRNAHRTATCARAELRPALSGSTAAQVFHWRVAAAPASVCDDWGAVMEGHLSVATIETLHKILRTCRNMRHVIGREPTPGEIAGRLGIPREAIRKLIGVAPSVPQY